VPKNCLQVHHKYLELESCAGVHHNYFRLGPCAGACHNISQVRILCRSTSPIISGSDPCAEAHDKQPK
jgi:hypothetical protein